jgi:hypothetical protein
MGAISNAGTAATTSTSSTSINSWDMRLGFDSERGRVGMKSEVFWRNGKVGLEEKKLLQLCIMLIPLYNNTVESLQITQRHLPDLL